MSRPAPGRLVVSAFLILSMPGFTGHLLPAEREPSPAPGQLVRAEDAVVALYSLQTQLEVDVKVLQRMEQRLVDNQRARDAAREKVDRLYVELDALFSAFRSASQSRSGREGDGDSEDGAEPVRAQIDAKRLEVMAAERVEDGVRDEGHRLRDDILAQRDRMSLLSAQLDTLIASLPTPRESVTGMWDITILPSGDKGVFALFQSGTVVTGQYTLAGPFQGSLDGTLIDRKLLLHRIDSRLGRSMDLTASLSLDGQALRGTWENYDLANGQARSGSWSARRRPQRRPGEEADGEDGAPR